MRTQALSLVRSLVVAAVLSSTVAFTAQAGDKRFPTAPDAQLTPGDVCHRPDAYRYPERIAYCNRDVDGGEKRDIIAMYDRERGYNIRGMDRQQFKIDHYIPLCMGGSNERDNLWPQHKSVYELTDPMEGLACEKMAEGRLKQADAIRLIKEGKNDFKKIDGIVEYLNGL